MFSDIPFHSFTAISPPFTLQHSFCWIPQFFPSVCPLVGSFPLVGLFLAHLSVSLFFFLVCFLVLVIGRLVFNIPMSVAPLTRCGAHRDYVLPLNILPKTWSSDIYSTHWGQGLVYQASKLQVNCEEMEKEPTNLLTQHALSKFTIY